MSFLKKGDAVHIYHEHLNKHSLIRDFFHGFTIDKSCLTRLLSFYEKYVYEAADKDHYHHHHKRGAYTVGSVASGIRHLQFERSLRASPH